jgi:hypothetical protein
MKIKKNSENKSKLNKIVLFIFIFLFSILQVVFSQTITISPNRSIEECKKMVLEKGDERAYYDLYFALNNENCNGEYLFYSLVMSQKYNYPGAYYWVYKCIVSFYEDNNIAVDTQSLNIALCFLRKGVELDNKNAQIELGELYLKGKYVTKDTIKGKELYSKGWGIPEEKLSPFWRRK